MTDIDDRQAALHNQIADMFLGFHQRMSQVKRGKTIDAEAEARAVMAIIAAAARQARIDELKAVELAADKIDRMDACGCDEYIPKRIAALTAEQEATTTNKP